MSDVVTIGRVGAKGDGIADGADGLFVPYTLPGEVVTVERDGARGHLVSVEQPSPERAEPFCPYFGHCGGCATQHMRETFYRHWKHGLVTEAMRRAHIAAPIDPLIDAHGEGRRRITLHGRFPGRDARVGYMAQRSHQIVEIDHCPIAEPSLRVHGPVVARALTQHLAPKRKPLDIQITASEFGLDVDLRGYGPMEDRERLSLTVLAADLDLARLSLHGETLVERRPPVTAMGRAKVVPPPGSFLQATRAGEEALAQRVVEACSGAKRVADLFAGSGPFSLRLAETSDVHAVEMDRASITALDKAARLTTGLRRITSEARDLFRRPLLTTELAAFDAVVLDPPRAGADMQMRQIAVSRVPLVVSVSCDAGTFARDAAILLAAGYRLEQITPVDQFKYSPHVELVGILRRDVARKRR